MRPDYTDRLRPRWQAAFRGLGLDPPMTAFAELVERYSEPARAYHTLQHLAECFDRLDETEAPRSAAISIALFFHDAVYDAAAKDNEERSAAWAATVLGAAGAARETIDAVASLILATRHDQVPQEPAEQLIVDIDLSILGAERERYDEYEEQIRREYAFVPAEAFRLGRGAILRKFLERPAIFSTVHFRSRYEARARKNLAEALASLES